MGGPPRVGHGGTNDVRAMAQAKRPIYLNEELLRAAEARAAETGETADEVVESAVRVYLGGLAAVLHRIRPRRGMSEDEALRLAYEEIDAHRASKQ